MRRERRGEMRGEMRRNRREQWVVVCRLKTGGWGEML
jgi:hypothetical protein